MKKSVSDEQFVEAYGNLDTPTDKLTKAQKDNRKILKVFAYKYRNILSEEEISACSLQALLRCLENHEHDKGQKFTTSLWVFSNWEFRREAKKKRLDNEKYKNTFRYMDLDNFDVAETKLDLSQTINEYMEFLNSDEKQLVIEYYIDGMTMEEIGKKHNFTKETARQKIAKAIKKLQNKGNLLCLTK